MWAWNKVALLQKVLKETPPERAPWILYMQPDTIIDDIAFTFPFEMYQDKHWVSVGKAESVLNGWASGRPLTSDVYAALERGPLFTFCVAHCRTTVLLQASGMSCTLLYKTDPWSCSKVGHCMYMLPSDRDLSVPKHGLVLHAIPQSNSPSLNDRSALFTAHTLETQ